MTIQLEASTRLRAATPSGNKLTADIIKKFKAQKLDVKLKYIDDDKDGGDQMEFTVVTPTKKVCTFSIGPCSTNKPTWLEFEYNSDLDPVNAARVPAAKAPMPSTAPVYKKSLKKWYTSISARAALCEKASIAHSDFIKRFGTAADSIL